MDTLGDSSPNKAEVGAWIVIPDFPSSNNFWCAISANLSIFFNDSLFVYGSCQV